MGSKSMFRKLSLTVLTTLLAACAEGDNFAPVTDISHIEPLPASGVYYVSAKESLYEVAWRYGLDYRQLADINHIPAPYTVQVGQMLCLKESIAARRCAAVTAQPLIPAPPEANKIALPVTSTSSSSSTGTIDVKPVVSQPIVAQREMSAMEASNGWVWPAKGQIIGEYSPKNKGINIAGRLGEPVYAAASGMVVYSGDGLRSYGNLIIIKHNSSYLSAYAHNDRMLVKEGDAVRQGQKIAELGNTGTDKPMLHFEVRLDGKPINPMTLFARKKV